MGFRVGQGHDLHRLAPGEDLVIGGIHIPYRLGTVAHSDGDVMLHSIIDALLGSCSLGDIGQYFPESDASIRGIASSELLRRILELDALKEIRIVNIDSTIQLQSPKVSSFLPAMRENIAKLLNMDSDRISIKAKTGECCDSIGRKEAIACDVIILIER
jgi:2-C-methyl-D-erythritol 2,4-cyclodiphosphate synthase